MSIARDLTGVVEVIEHAKLQHQLVQIGSSLEPVHRQRRVAVARAQIAKDLIVGPVLLNDVDNMTDRVRTRLELQMRLRSLHHVARNHFRRKLRQFALRSGNINSGERSMKQRSDVSMRTLHPPRDRKS